MWPPNVTDRLALGRAVRVFVRRRSRHQVSAYVSELPTSPPPTIWMSDGSAIAAPYFRPGTPPVSAGTGKGSPRIRSPTSRTVRCTHGRGAARASCDHGARRPTARLGDRWRPARHLRRRDGRERLTSRIQSFPSRCGPREIKAQLFSLTLIESALIKICVSEWPGTQFWRRRAPLPSSTSRDLKLSTSRTDTPRCRPWIRALPRSSPQRLLLRIALNPARHSTSLRPSAENECLRGNVVSVDQYRPHLPEI